MQNLGTAFVISAPSGAGKTTMTKALLQELDHLTLSISHTTRTKRHSEIDGKDYHFVSQDEFLNLREQGAFFEWAEVFGNYYATSEEELLQPLRSGKDVLLDIDWQGARRVAKILPNNHVRIFLLPPSKDILVQRLTTRSEDSQEVIQQRMQSAKQEMTHYAEYDYLVVNDDFKTTVNNLVSIIKANNLQTFRQQYENKKLLCSLLK